ncbi:methionine--tRNA ligase subunit beta [Staphylothermus hellenicus]|uniref:Methionine--tRNA ligase n=1 Tax=Staphylothermus hellenicus (strain DSM 12710 / JCM 10830 / BK20S6-10-b1 / P8) TaxID=591019 RepID=D7DBE2_STAHD|nr:methionine--tRNA ligase subunit beta [Staphylothermus hellenicus]ADI31489.1 t-RNA-binding domain protein [Staphylothermus hellenicus DSM 12710]
MSSSEVSYEEFMRIDLRVGFVKEAEKVKGSKKLLKLKVDLGKLGERQIIAGLGAWYSPDDLIGKYIVVVANLKPKRIFGLVSQGMLLAADSEDGVPVLLSVEKPVKPGTRIR